ARPLVAPSAAPRATPGAPAIKPISAPTVVPTAVPKSGRALLSNIERFPRSSFLIMTPALGLKSMIPESLNFLIAPAASYALFVFSKVATIIFSDIVNLLSWEFHEFSSKIPTGDIGLIMYSNGLSFWNRIVADDKSDLINRVNAKYLP